MHKTVSFKFQRFNNHELWKANWTSTKHPIVNPQVNLFLTKTFPRYFIVKFHNFLENLVPGGTKLSTINHKIVILKNAFTIFLVIQSCAITTEFFFHLIQIFSSKLKLIDPV